jgi:glucose uptake protein
MRATVLLWLAGSSVIFLAAATATRHYVGNNNIVWLLLSLSLYVVGNLVMVRIMREGGLGLAVSISAIAQLLLVNLVAFALFGEKLTVMQMSGLALGIASMTLLMWPQGGST